MRLGKLISSVFFLLLLDRLSVADEVYQRTGTTIIQQWKDVIITEQNDDFVKFIRFQNDELGQWVVGNGDVKKSGPQERARLLSSWLGKLSSAAVELKSGETHKLLSPRIIYPLSSHVTYIGGSPSVKGGAQLNLGKTEDSSRSASFADIELFELLPDGRSMRIKWVGGKAS